MENFMIIIFGATGDLTKRKLIPALYALSKNKSLKQKIPIICVARKVLNKEDFISSLEIKKFIPKANNDTLSRFLKQIHYYSIDFKKPNIRDFKKFLKGFDLKFDCQNNKIMYFALPANIFNSALKITKGITTKKGVKKLVFEKPFGRNLKSAKLLNSRIKKYFTEEEIYRIDHYLAKELVQNLLVFRFSNAIFEEIWSNKFVDHVQITLYESIGVEGRGNYYEKAGAIRDIIQNHALQLLALSAMDEPKSVSADFVRAGKVKLLQSICKIKPGNLVIGQYGPGKIKGKNVPGYRREFNVDIKSNAETFAALKIEIDNEKWKGVPFYIRTGKRMKRRFAEINIVLKEVASKLFCDNNCKSFSNRITFRIQPNEGIAVKFNSKIPGAQIQLHPVLMDFCHHCLFGLNTPEAYELLLGEIIKGDQTLFTRWDSVLQSWKLIDPLLKTIKKKKINFPNYKAGSYGPKAADLLIENDGRKWINEVEQ